MIRKNRNKLDEDIYKEYLKKKSSEKTEDEHVRQYRIKENINQWEQTIPEEFRNIPYNKKLAKLINNSKRFRTIISSNDTYTNYRKMYSVIKHLINAGITPSKITSITLDEAILNIRGYGESAQINRKLFNPNNELVIITGMRNIKVTDNKENAIKFWLDFNKFFKKYKYMNFILVFDEFVEDWKPISETQTPIKLENIGAIKI